ncbi:MAG: hypothetical protein NZ519_13145 [Bacteroidia bacterium]|nr:hypothetical protein [Bacteroidia bacterium]
MRKNRIAWGLLIVWVFYTCLYTPLVMTYLIAHHKTVTHLLKNKKQALVHLCIPIEDKNFTRINEKECIWQNQWYDIEKIEEKEGYYHILAHTDIKEKTLMSNLQNLLELFAVEKASKTKSISKFELKDTYLTTLVFRFLPSTYPVFGNITTCLCLPIPEISLPEPPPKILR